MSARVKPMGAALAVTLVLALASNQEDDPPVPEEGECPTASPTT